MSDNISLEHRMVAACVSHPAGLSERECALARLGVPSDSEVPGSVPGSFGRRAQALTGRSASFCLGVMDGWDRTSGRTVFAYGWDDASRDHPDYAAGFELGKRCWLAVAGEAARVG